VPAALVAPPVAKNTIVRMANDNDNCKLTIFIVRRLGRSSGGASSVHPRLELIT